MAMTPEQFFSKNMKWFALVFACLFIYKTVQSCNRRMELTTNQKQYTHIIDSLKNKSYILEDSLKKLNFDLKLKIEQANSVNERAMAVQNAVEKIKSNTTVVVKGAEEIKDNNKK